MDPTTYQEALKVLHKCPTMVMKLSNNTTMYGWTERGGPWNKRELFHPPDSIFVELHRTRIIEYRPDGSFLLNGDYSNTTRERIRRFTSFWPFVCQGCGFLAVDKHHQTVRPYFPGMEVTAEGQLLGEAKWLNQWDAKKYFDAVRSYASKLSTQATHGNLRNWTLSPEQKFARIRELLVQHVTSDTRAGYIIDLCLQCCPTWEQNDFIELRSALVPNTYRRYFKKPKEGTKAEFQRYVDQLTGEYKKFSFGHPKHQKEKLVQMLRSRLLEAFNLGIV